MNTGRGAALTLVIIAHNLLFPEKIEKIYRIFTNMRTKIISVVFLLISVLLLQDCTRITSAGKTSNIPVKVISYNIHIASPPSVKPDFSVTDLKAVAAVINREKPDLIALQEVDAYTIRSGKDSHQAKDLAEMTGMHYHFAKAIDHSEGDYGAAVLSRHPIIESESHKLSVTEGSGGEIRPLAIVTVDLAGEKVVFMSVHLDHRSDVDRRFQVEQLLDVTRLHDQDPVILCGDFNMRPENEIFNLIRQQFSMIGEKQPFTHSSTNPTRTLDYILLNKKASELFEIVNYTTVDEKYASDHLPVMLEFVIKREN